MSTSVLTNKKIKVVPIRRTGGWLRPDHDGSFMYTGTKFTLSVPRDKSGQLVDPLGDLTQEQKEDLAKKISRTADELSIYRTDKNFWTGYNVNGEWYRPFEVTLDKTIKILDLSKPMDYLAYKVLLANSEFVAPSSSDKFQKGTYKFALVDEDEEIAERKNSADRKLEAYKIYGKMVGSESKMRNFLRVYGLKKSFTVPKNAKKDWMEAEIDKVMESDINGFLQITGDPDYEMRLFVLDAVDAGALKKTGKDEYSLLGGKEIGSLVDTIKFMKEPKNQHEYATIKARLEAKE